MCGPICTFVDKPATGSLVNADVVVIGHATDLVVAANVPKCSDGKGSLTKGSTIRLANRDNGANKDYALHNREPSCCHGLPTNGK